MNNTQLATRPYVLNAATGRSPLNRTRGRWLRAAWVCAVVLCVTSAASTLVRAEPPEGLIEYKGRLIAQTMHYAGAEWLIRDEREREERCSLMLANLGVKRGMTICDMGCGNGFYALQLAQMAGANGQVLAVDIQPEMLVLLRERMEAENIGNITPILGSLHDPYLPDESCDLIVLVDVYHEFSHPEHMLAAMRKALKPDGLVVLVEFRSEDPKVPIKEEHKMSKKQILKELSPNGFELVTEFDGLPWQHMMFFGRDDRDLDDRGPPPPGERSQETPPAQVRDSP